VSRARASGWHWSEPLRVGAAYRYAPETIRSLGDLRTRTVDGKFVSSFWDIEKPRFALVQGPAWLKIDENTGALSGVPDAAGPAEVAISVTLERTVRRLDESRLIWGAEVVQEVRTEKVGSTTQRFKLTVDK